MGMRDPGWIHMNKDGSGTVYNVAIQKILDMRLENLRLKKENEKLQKKIDQRDSWLDKCMNGQLDKLLASANKK